MISTFELQEAVSLINKMVSKKGTKVTSTTDIGIISGVLAMNDQIELVIKFENVLDQSTKNEFYKLYTIYEGH